MEASGAGDVPLYYVCVDAEAQPFCISVLGLAQGAVKQASPLAVADPELTQVDAEWEGASFGFQKVRVDAPHKLVVGGRPAAALSEAPRLQTATFNR